MAQRTLYGWFSRWIDFALALLGLLVLAPILGLIALAVAADSGRPVLYRGLRVGRHGRLFRIIKFRTMVTNAERLGSSVTRDSDDRVTRIGHFLRRWKVDEFPQLWNILKGEMSLIGPRPEVPEIVQSYTSSMKQSLLVRPGLTSVASLWLRDETALLRGCNAPDEIYEQIIVPAKVELAMMHSDRHSFAFDWGILVATVGAWLRLRSPSEAEKKFLATLRDRLEGYSTGGDARLGSSSHSEPRSEVESLRHAVLPTE